jgi:hypothetical protein
MRRCRCVPFGGLFRLHRRKNSPRARKPKSRERRRPGAPNKHQVRPDAIIQHDCPSASPFKTWTFRGKTQKVESYKIRQSVRWIKDYNPKCRRVIGLPFINHAGKMSFNNVVRWYCHPLQAIASITATVFQRLQTLLIRRHKTKYAFGCREDTFRAALLYTITSDTWILDRFIGVMRRKERKPLKYLFGKFVAKLDEDQQFVYSQALQQANWLTFRAERPRDKSRAEIKFNPWAPLRESKDCPCLGYSCPYGSLLVSSFPRMAEY